MGYPRERREGGMRMEQNYQGCLWIMSVGSCRACLTRRGKHGDELRQGVGAVVDGSVPIVA